MKWNYGIDQSEPLPYRFFFIYIIIYRPMYFIAIICFGDLLHSLKKI